MTAPNNRHSGIELLRLIAMLMVLAVHFDGATFGLPLPDASWGYEDFFKTVVESISIIGVDIFVLISGYFGIRLTSHRLGKYISMCLFYSLSIFFLSACLKPSLFSADALFSRGLMIFSKTDLWFVRDYFFLMLLSPLLNAGLQNIGRPGLNRLVIVLVVINCYFGWLMGGKVNPTGYNIMQMILLYCLGFWLRCGNFTFAPKWLWMAYVCSLFGVIGCAHVLPSEMAYAYNSPFVLIEALAVFCLFARMNFSNRVVNYLASSAFAVYLVHKNPYVWGGMIKPTLIKMHALLPQGQFLLAAGAFMFAIFFGCIMLDKMRLFFQGFLKDTWSNLNRVRKLRRL